MTDTDRIAFLDSLLQRTEYVNKKMPKNYVKTTIHITGPDNCSIFARDIVGIIEFKGHGSSMREAIDEAIQARDKFEEKKR